MTTNTQSRIHPFYPIASLNENGMAFANAETGEILDFPASWRTNLDGVEHIIMCNLSGDYEEQGVLFGSC